MGACATKPKVSKEGAEPIEKEEIVELPTEQKVVDREIHVAATDTVKEPPSLSNETENGAKEGEAKPVEPESVKPAEPELQVADHPAVEPEQKKEEEKPATTPVVEKIEVPVAEPEQKKEKAAAAPAVEKVEVPVVVVDAPVKAVEVAATPKETVAEKTIQVSK